MRTIALVVIEKVLIDGLASAETLVDAVPIVDPRLSQFPAEVDFGSAEQSGKVDQTDIQILDQATDLLYAFDCIAQSCRSLFAPGLGFHCTFTIDHDPAQHHDALVHRLDRALRLLVDTLSVYGAAQQAFYFRKQALRFVERKALGHVQDVQIPDTCMESDRLRGPSNSARMILCQVPSSTHELRTCRHRLCPMIIPRRCESAFFRSQSE